MKLKTKIKITLICAGFMFILAIISSIFTVFVTLLEAKIMFALLAYGNFILSILFMWNTDLMYIKEKLK